MRSSKGSSIIEYVIVILVILGALYVISPYITRAFFGKWKSSGETFAFGKRYDPSATATCAFVQIRPNYGIWHDTNCYVESVRRCAPGDHSCEEAAMDSCATTYCCEFNKLPTGESNCPSTS